ncbi:hypothetical protein [Marinobacter sp.]|uniref:hypothetical protein n=1 Tax=Marinobacter sp. TaxID=50741 RepID=UPI003567827E
MESNNNRYMGRTWIRGLALCTVLGLTACGGGGGGGGSSSSTTTFNESAATIASEADAKTAAEATTQAATQAVIEDEAANFAPVAAQINSFNPNEVTKDLSLEILEVANLPSGATYVYDGECGGSASVTSDNQSRMKIVYDNYCMPVDATSNYVLNGVYDVTYTLSGDQVTGFSADFDYAGTYAGETYRSKGNVSCTGEFLENCTYSSTFNGTNGRAYRISGVSVTGDQYSGYNISARVYDGDRGYVEFQGSGLIPCSGGGFSSGTITFSDSDGEVITATFSTCGEYTVTYKGSSVLVTQN